MLISEILDCRVVALEKNVHLRKKVIGIFEIFENPFLSQHSQNLSVVQSGSGLETIVVQL